MTKLCLIAALTALAIHASAQESLPEFSVDSLGGSRTRISWANSYGDGLVQVSVQSSYDSVKNFRTFFSSPSPQLPMNGFVDNRKPGKVYYRIFYAFSGGSYGFTKAKLVGGGAIVAQEEPDGDELVARQPRGYSSSKYVLVNAAGFAEIKLPDAGDKKYRLVFFDENNSPLFSLEKITEPDLTLDKTNFLHAGNFTFELYDGDTLVEKNKIFLPREF